MEIDKVTFSPAQTAGSDEAKAAPRAQAAEGRQAVDAKGPARAQGTVEGRKEAGAAQGGKQFDEAVRHLDDYVQNHERDLRFNVDDATGRTIIKVIDPETDEVIRQIPQEEVMELARFLKEQGETKEGGILRVEA